jgi:apolipoprotein N-acyltransferase
MQTTLKIITLLSAAVIATFIGSEMTAIALYEYWTFYLFVSVFIAAVTLWSFFISPLANKEKMILYSVLSGVLLHLGFTPYVWSPLLFVALMPLLYVEQNISLLHEKAAKMEVFKFSFIAFMTWNILTTWWVGNSAIAAGVFAIIANSLLMCIPFIGFHAIKKRLGATLGYTALIAFWLTFEHIHLQWDFMWPWLNLGNGFAATPSLVQWYEFTGYSGGTLWVLLVNILGFRFSVYRTNLSMRIHWVERRIWVPITLIFLPIALSFSLYYDVFGINTIERKNGKEIVVVQPNYEPHYEKFNIPDSEQIPIFEQTAKKTLTEESDYLVFPETSFGGIIQSEMDMNPTMLALHNFVDSFPHLHLITGLSSYKKYTPNEPRAATVHHGNAFDYESYNSAEQISSHDPRVPHYIKSKLVPGIERLPYFQYLGFMAPFTEKFGGTPSSLGLGTPLPFWDEKHQNAVGTLICYESIFGELAAEHVQKGANMLFIITNDGWWGNTPGHRQHLDIGRLRAIETRRPIARSANTGISAFIDTKGDIVKATKYNERTALKCVLYPNSKITFYVKYGDYIARLGILTSILLILYAIFLRFKNK